MENGQIILTQHQGCATNKPCPTAYIMNKFRVESGNWYTNVKLPNNTEESQEHQASEAATIAASRFFAGSVHVTDINQPHTFTDLIKVTANQREYLFYSPKMIANAGWHEEADLLHKRIIKHNYEIKV